MAWKNVYDFRFVFQATGGSRSRWRWLLVLRRVWKRYCKIAWIHEVSRMDHHPMHSLYPFLLHRAPSLPIFELEFQEISYSDSNYNVFKFCFIPGKNCNRTKFLWDYTNSGLLPKRKINKKQIGLRTWHKMNCRTVSMPWEG